MISCKDCIENLKPDDPRVKSGKYRLCGCDYCNKPDYYRQLEGLKDDVQVIQPSPKELQDSFHKTQVLVNDLMSRLNGHIDASKKKGKY